jgi:hypothetical protein
MGRNGWRLVAKTRGRDADDAPAGGDELLVSRAIVLESVRGVVGPTAIELDDEAVGSP